MPTNCHRGNHAEPAGPHAGGAALTRRRAAALSMGSVRLAVICRLIPAGRPRGYIVLRGGETCAPKSPKTEPEQPMDSAFGAKRTDKTLPYTPATA